MPKTQRSRARVTLAAVLLGLLTLLVSCQVTTVPVTIESFKATPSTITAGQQSTLSWSVKGSANSIKILAGATEVAGSLPASGSRAVSPTSTTEYSLVATDASGKSVTRKVTVTIEANVPVAITSFTATPTVIDAGGSSTLAWEVVGDTSDVRLMAGTTLVEDGLTAEGSMSVSPAATTEYSLIATATEGGEVTATLTVTLADPTVTPPTITSVDATVVRGSQFTATWVATGATAFDVVAFDAANPDAAVAIPGGAGISGTETSATLPIPDSGHQSIRVVARNAGGQSQADSASALTNVVLNVQDSDPYDPGGLGNGEPAIAGSFRQVVDDAPAGAIIGFASDVVAVGVIELPGVQLASRPGGGVIDSHIYISKDVTISGPATGITLLGVSGYEVGDPGTEFSWMSRVLFVETGATVEIDDITISGGDFIYTGGGIRNYGTLTMNRGAVTGNRAWYTGGGIHNNGVLVLNGTTVSNNEAATFEDEVGQDIPIRGNPTFGTGPIVIGGWGGGIYNEIDATVELNDVDIQGNAARLTGGGIANDGVGTVAVVGGSIIENEASDLAYPSGPHNSSLGGGVFSVGDVSLSGTLIRGNDALNLGGGLAISTPGVADVTSASSFIENSADYGGAIQVWYCPGGDSSDVLTLDASTVFSGNINRVAGLDISESLVPSCPAPTALSTSAAASAYRSPFLPSLEVLEQGARR